MLPNVQHDAKQSLYAIDMWRTVWFSLHRYHRLERIVVSIILLWKQLEISESIYFSINLLIFLWSIRWCIIFNSIINSSECDKKKSVPFVHISTNSLTSRISLSVSNTFIVTKYRNDTWTSSLFDLAAVLWSDGYRLKEKLLLEENDGRGIYWECQGVGFRIF